MRLGRAGRGLSPVSARRSLHASERPRRGSLGSVPGVSGPHNRSRRETMTYVEGFVVAVPTANKDAYRKHAAEAAPLFKESACAGMVEAWGDDVQRRQGDRLQGRGAGEGRRDSRLLLVRISGPRDPRRGQREDDERPAHARRWATMPFDGKRMIFGGFDTVRRRAGRGRRSNYIDGFVLPVPEGKRQAYHEMAAKAARQVQGIWRDPRGRGLGRRRARRQGHRLPEAR